MSVIRRVTHIIFELDFIVMMYRKIGKRLFDLLVSICLLIVLSPILLITCIVLFWQNKGSVFFFQERPGKVAQPFFIIKFKSMTDAKDALGNLLPDNQRITLFGGLVRKLSIDELPQLINVLKGDMSLIGPRPLLFKYLPLYSKDQMRRHDVRPGITGWAQVNGRNSISWTEKFAKDVEYVDNVSFLLDCKIVFFTILKIIKRDGINQSAERPMEPFNGQN
jgi:undecaprenyl phosphate N,N'-diacetylbacillosamine 1-phosphate transferase